MGAFSGASYVLTALGPKVGQSDNSLAINYQGSAPLNTIALETFLPGTTGVDCKLVNGDRWQEITGKMTQDVGGDKTSTYGGAFTETYNGDVTRNMNGASFEENYYGAGGNTRDYYTHLEETFYLGHKQSNYVEELEVRTSKSEAIQQFSWESNPCKAEALGFGFTIAGVDIGIATILQFESGVFGISFRGLELGYSGFRFEYGGLTQEAKAMKSVIDTLEVEVGALVVDSRALSVVENVIGQGFLTP